MKDKKASRVVVVEESLQLVTLRVGAETYGIDINSITEVIRPLRITPLPKMPPFVEGVINLRGVIIPVVDLRNRFELRTTKNDSRKMRMVITRGAVSMSPTGSTGLLALVVDGVDEVIHVPKKNIELAPPAATGKTEFITGMGKMGDRLIIVLDITRILSQQERNDLVEAGTGENGEAEKKRGK